MSGRLDKVISVFNEVVDAPEAERDEILHRLCEGDSELRQEVERYLEADRDATDDETWQLQPLRVSLIESLGRSADRPSGDPFGLIGTVLNGRYRIDALIDSGGMGVVYRAEQKGLGPVAVKVLRPELQGASDAIRRLQFEGLAPRLVRHPNVVTVHDADVTEDGLAYLVLEFLPGRTLRDILAEKGHVEVERALLIVAEVAKALDAAHERNIVHRDLKPENIMLVESSDGTESVKVLDFGIAKVMDAGTGDEGQTHTRGAIGTPAYMSPERMPSGDRNHIQAADHRSDIFALAVVFVELVSGSVPRAGMNAGEIRELVQPHAGSLITIGERFYEAIETALADDPKRRPERATGFVHTLRLAATASPGRSLGMETVRISPQATNEVRPRVSRSVVVLASAVGFAILALIVGLNWPRPASVAETSSSAIPATDVAWNIALRFHAELEGGGPAAIRVENGSVQMPGSGRFRLHFIAQRPGYLHVYYDKTRILLSGERVEAGQQVAIPGGLAEWLPADDRVYTVVLTDARDAMRDAVPAGTRDLPSEPADNAEVTGSSSLDTVTLVPEFQLDSANGVVSVVTNPREGSPILMFDFHVRRPDQ